MSNYIQIYNDASNVSKKRIVRELKLFNEKYNPIMKSIQNKTINGNYDFLPELISLDFAPWIGKVFSYRMYSYGSSKRKVHNHSDSIFASEIPEIQFLNKISNKSKFYDFSVSDFMGLSTFLASYVPLAMHVLNKSFEKINFNYLFYVKDSENDPENMKKIMDNDLESRCKNYLITLPNIVTLENVDLIDLIAEQNHIPKFSENPNHDITTRIKKPILSLVYLRQYDSTS